MSHPPPNSREWDAAEYHRLSTPQFQWGQRVLSELHLRGDECVLDAGCGTGKLTRLLLQNLPRGRVVGLDVSRNMVRHARRDLQAEFGDRAQFVAADLLVLPFCEVFDGIFSTASFHWVLDHDALFRNLFCGASSWWMAARAMWRRTEPRATVRTGTNTFTNGGVLAMARPVSRAVVFLCCRGYRSPVALGWVP